MSAWSSQKITCSKCGYQYKMEVLVSWNFALGPMPKQPSYHCPNCGKENNSDDRVDAIYFNAGSNIGTL